MENSASHIAAKNRYYALDIARFMAAFAVMIYHFTATGLYNVGSGRPVLDAPKAAFPELYQVTKFGFLGVHLFFMISGFVILASALNRKPFDFAFSRFIRLYPTYWICLSITSVFLYFHLGPKFDITLFDYLVSLTMVQKFAGVSYVDPVYWTLFYELQFYACVFLLMLIGAIKYIRVWISIWLLMTACYLLFGQPYFMPKFITPEYSPYFIAGVCFYMATREGFSFFVNSVLSACYLLTCYTLYTAMPGDDRIFTFWDLGIEVVVTLIFYLLFWGVVSGKLSFSKNRWVIFLGGLTYPLYLVHFAIGRYLYHEWIQILAPWQVVCILMFLALTVSSIVYYVSDVLLVPAIKKRVQLNN